MSPIGYYWRDAFRCAEALYSPAPDLVFTACHFDEEQHEGDYYSEFDDPILEEVRLHGSLAISLGWDQGMVSLYPHVWQLKLPELVDLSSPAVEAALRTQLSGSDFSADYKLASDPAPPPRHGGPAYQFRNSPTPTELQLRIFRAIPLNDHLLLRGMSAWLKANMLRHHRQFSLEALYSMYVSLDASFSLVCRELRRRGVQNPSAIDAGRYLDEAEGREPEVLLRRLLITIAFKFFIPRAGLVCSHIRLE